MKYALIQLLVLSCIIVHAGNPSEHLQNLNDVKKHFGLLPAIQYENFDKRYEFSFDEKGKIAIINEVFYQPGTVIALDSSIRYEFKLRQINTHKVAFNKDMSNDQFSIEIISYANKLKISKSTILKNNVISTTHISWLSLGSWPAKHFENGELCVNWLAISVYSSRYSGLRSKAIEFHNDTGKNLYPLPGLIQNSQSGKFYVVQMPIFDGAKNKAKGDKKFQECLQQNIKKVLSKHHIDKSGKVTVSLNVDKKGKIADLKIMDSTNIELNSIVQEIFEDMPGFTPGIQGGRVVKVSYKVPVTFRAPGDYID